MVCSFFKKKSLAQVFSCKFLFSEIFKKNCFVEHA